MIIKDELAKDIGTVDKLRSLLKGIGLPYPYGFWFEKKNKWGNKWDDSIAIWKVTSGNPSDFHSQYDSEVADIKLLDNDVVEIGFYYKDSYNYLRDYFEYSQTKFKITAGDDSKVY